MRFGVTWVLVAIVWFLWGTSRGGAHELNLSSIKIRLEKQGVGVSVVAHLHDFQQRDPAAEIPRRLKLRLDGQTFEPRGVSLKRDNANGIVLWQARSSRPAQQVAVEAPLFPERPDLATVVTVLKDGRALDDALLNAQNASVVIEGGEGPPALKQVLGKFLVEGVRHIFLGPDHVLFLASLLLLQGGWKQLLKIATAFTLAHSITLSLAATGVMSLPPRLVEPAIALSIVAVAFLNLRPQSEGPGPSRDWRPVVAFGFGLIHGFGFAGALAELGLPQESLGWALVAFNLGVELGQAGLVLLFAPLLAFLVKTWPKTQKPIVYYSSIGVAAVGAFWFAQRLFSV